MLCASNESFVRVNNVRLKLNVFKNLEFGIWNNRGTTKLGYNSKTRSDTRSNYRNISFCYSYVGYTLEITAMYNETLYTRKYSVAQSARIEFWLSFYHRFPLKRSRKYLFQIYSCTVEFNVKNYAQAKIFKISSRKLLTITWISSLNGERIKRRRRHWEIWKYWRDIRLKTGCRFREQRTPIFKNKLILTFDEHEWLSWRIRVRFVTKTARFHWSLIAYTRKKLAHPLRSYVTQK